jgi:hypothetical protein
MGYMLLREMRVLLRGLWIAPVVVLRKNRLLHVTELLLLLHLMLRIGTNIVLSNPYSFLASRVKKPGCQRLPLVGFKFVSFFKLRKICSVGRCLLMMVLRDCELLNIVL